MAAFISGSDLLLDSKRLFRIASRRSNGASLYGLGRIMATLFDLLFDCKIKLVNAVRMSLTEAVHAHELVSSGSVMGRIVLVCG